MPKLTQSPKPRQGSPMVNVRFDPNNLAMLDKLCETYNVDRSTLIRMAMKQMYDRVFGPKGGQSG